MSPPGPFEVRFSDPALEDLNRLFDFLLERAVTADDLEVAQRAIDEVRAACSGSLSTSPFSYRKSDQSALRRELIIPFGSTGYVAQYEIEPGPSRVIILAVRHQREDDYQ